MRAAGASRALWPVVALVLTGCGSRRPAAPPAPFESEGYWRGVLARDPDHPEAPYELAVLQRDRPDEALAPAALAVARARSPHGRTRALLLRGRIEADLDKAELARLSFEAALRETPGDLDALAALARVTRSSSSVAAAYADQACQTAGQAPFWKRAAALKLCGRIQWDLERFAQAASAYDRALDFDPDDPDALMGMAYVRAVAPGLVRVRPRSVGAQPPQDVPLEALRAEPALREAVGSPDALLRAIEALPEWQKASALRLAAAYWASLGRAKEALRMAQNSQSVDLHSVSCAKLVLSLEGKAASPGTKAGAVAAYVAASRARRELGDEAGARGLLSEVTLLTGLPAGP